MQQWKGDNLKVGNVVKTKENGLLVITEMENGKVKRFEKLEDYISEIITVKFGDEYRSIKDIVEAGCEQYLSENEMIEFDETDS